MSDDTIKLLRGAIAAGPTPGPWMHLVGDRLIYTKLGDGCKGEAVARVDWISGPSYLATLSFIAAASPDNIRALLDRLDAAERENERLREDARRYRWLRGDACPDHSVRWTQWEVRCWRSPVWSYDLRRQELDQAIDDARAAEEKKR